MIVTDITAASDYPARLRSLADEDGLVRSPGLHLTTILHDIRQMINPRDPIDQQDLEMYGAMGFLWERVHSRAHADAVARGDMFRPGEFERDGIAGSPDMLDMEHIRLIELKCRWMSSKKFDQLEKNFYFELLQIKCYLAMLGWTEAELTVLFVCGDWAPPVPVVRSVLLEFTEREIEETWRSVVNHARSKGMLP